MELGKMQQKDLNLVKTQTFLWIFKSCKKHSFSKPDQAAESLKKSGYSAICDLIPGFGCKKENAW